MIDWIQLNELAALKIMGFRSGELREDYEEVSLPIWFTQDLHEGTWMYQHQWSPCTDKEQAIRCAIIAGLKWSDTDDPKYLVMEALKVKGVALS